MDPNTANSISDGGIICGARKCDQYSYLTYSGKNHTAFCGKMNSNPDGGVTNFDNIFWAFIMAF